VGAYWYAQHYQDGRFKKEHGMERLLSVTKASLLLIFGTEGLDPTKDFVFIVLPICML